MIIKWGCGGQEVPDKGPDGPGVSVGSQQETFIYWSPLRNVFEHIKNGGVLKTLKKLVSSLRYKHIIKI